jgi:hypothetical protein
VDQARGWLGRADDETCRRESAPAAIESGEPLHELKQWVNVALNREWEENDVDAMVGACHSRMNVISRPAGCATVMF